MLFGNIFIIFWRIGFNDPCICNCGSVWVCECLFARQMEMNECDCIIYSLQLLNTYATCLMRLDNIWKCLNNFPHTPCIYFYACIKCCVLRVCLWISKNVVWILFSPNLIHNRQTVAKTQTFTHIKWARGWKIRTTIAEFAICISHTLPSLSYFVCWFIQIHFGIVFVDIVVRTSRRMLWMSTHYLHKKAREIPHSQTHKIIHFHRNHVRIVTIPCFWYVIDCSY